MNLTDHIQLMDLFWAGFSALTTFTVATLVSDPIKGLILALGLVGLEAGYILLLSQGGLGID